MILWSTALIAFLVAAILRVYLARSLQPRGIPRIGPKPGFLGNTSKSYFYSHSLELIQEGYDKYKDGLYSLWTTDMDRVIVSPKFMKDFMPLPRSTVRLTASIRHAGPYTGMDIAEESDLQFVVCASQLAGNIGRLAQPIYEEILYTLKEKLKKATNEDGRNSIALFPSLIDLVTSSTARVFVGPELCRNPDWLSTATGYTMEYASSLKLPVTALILTIEDSVARVTSDLKGHYRMFHPIIAPFLNSVKQIRRRFRLAKDLLQPLFETRSSENSKEYPDMMQWLVESAQGRDAEIDHLVKRMLFLNMAAIHTTAEFLTNVIMELCSKPDWIPILRSDMMESLAGNQEITLATLNGMKKTDSFIKETHRLNSLGLMTFNRHLAKPVTLHNGITLPADTYVSMTHHLYQRDAKYYPSPLEFDPLRFYKLRQKEGEEDKHQFASISSQLPWWGVGKFACPGRFWASAQVKLVLMVLILNFEIAFPNGQTERPVNVTRGEKIAVNAAQKITLKARKSEGT